MRNNIVTIHISVSTTSSDEGFEFSNILKIRHFKYESYGMSEYIFDRKEMKYGFRGINKLFIVTVKLQKVRVDYRHAS